MLRYDRAVSAPVDRDSVQASWEASSARLRSWFERRTGSAHDADDLVQETFTRVLARLSTLRAGERLDAWIGAIAAHALADHGRGRARRPTALAQGDDEAERAPPDDDADLRFAVAGWIEAFLARLSPEDAALLRAVDLEGRAQVDVARELGLAPSGARSRVQRARARLREHLEACCSFAFDARGNLTGARRRPGSACDCDGR